MQIGQQQKRQRDIQILGPMMQNLFHQVGRQPSGDFDKDLMFLYTFLNTDEKYKHMYEQMVFEAEQLEIQKQKQQDEAFNRLNQTPKR